MGRKRIPTETKRRRGNPSRRPLPIEPNFADVIDFATREAIPGAGVPHHTSAVDRSPAPGYPPPPEEIADDPIASGMWNVLLPQLSDAGVVKRPDQILLVEFCSAHSEVARARAVLSVEGRYIENRKTGMTHTHPALYNLHRFMLIKAKLAAEFGITPASRSRVPGGSTSQGNRFTRNGRKSGT